MCDPCSENEWPTYAAHCNTETYGNLRGNLWSLVNVINGVVFHQQSLSVGRKISF